MYVHMYYRSPDSQVLKSRQSLMIVIPMHQICRCCIRGLADKFLVFSLVVYVSMYNSRIKEHKNLVSLYITT